MLILIFGEQYMKTKEELAAYRRAWNEKNKDKKKAAARRYYKKNKETIKKQSQQYRHENTDKIKIRDRIRSKKFYYSNRNKILLRMKQDYRDNPIHFKNKHYFLNHKITLEKYTEMFNRQNGKCAICGTHQSKLPRNLAVDHNHNTGKIRGLLCFNCNYGLGRFHDNIDHLKNAITYLSTSDSFD